MTAQADFEKRIEVRFEQLLKVLNDRFEKSKGKAVMGEASSVLQIPIKLAPRCCAHWHMGWAQGTDWAHRSMHIVPILSPT